ncbi:MAG: cytochrome c oxidase assembly protein, partial [Dehalococcoidia bacterium]
LFVQSLIPTVVASFITFADHAIYSPYVLAPRLWGLSPISDQQIAGGIMKTVGALVIWWFIGLAFFRWYRDAQAEEKGPRWADVQDELEQLGISRR